MRGERSEPAAGDGFEAGNIWWGYKERDHRPGGASSEGALLAVRAHTHIRVHLAAVAVVCCCRCWLGVAAGCKITRQSGREMITATVLWRKLSWLGGHRDLSLRFYICDFRYLVFLGQANFFLFYCIRRWCFCCVCWLVCSLGITKSNIEQI